MIEWYYILGIISYGVFLIQFALSFLGSEIDADLDVDLDGEADFSFSDLISFKGLIHFLMGFSGWLMLTDKVTTFNIAIGSIVGISFVFILYWVYTLALKLQSIPTKKQGKELIGATVTIYLVMVSISKRHCICTIFNGGITEEINCIAASPVVMGDKRIILDYKDGIYYIS